MDDADKTLFESFGLAGALKQIGTNPALGAAVKQTIAASGLNGTNVDKSIGNMLFTAASALNDARAHRRDYIAKYIGSGKIKGTQNLNAALDFLKKKTSDAEFSNEEFEKACGVGVEFSDAQIKAHAVEVLNAVRSEVTTQRYLYPLHTLLAAAKDGDWRWADGKALKEAVDAAILEALGPKTGEDEKREAEAKAANKGKAKSAPAAPAPAPAAETRVTSPPAASAAVHTAGSVETTFAARELKAAVNTPQLVAQHVAATKGVVRTRFPPEPNGFLHIGHAKSMNLNFEGAFRALGLAPEQGQGETIFRYDDTNPDAETKEYIDNMAENVAWMGWKPVATTHSSDYFPQLYDFALRLIKKGVAYVCHQTKDDMEASREISRAITTTKDPKTGKVQDPLAVQAQLKAEGKPWNPNSPYRDRGVEENLREFDNMRLGKFKEGEATLRLKIDMLHPNPTLWDPVAYRIKYTPHPHTGDRWCIYPSYDYSHSLIDSLENIDYSLCTLEFEVRRDLYYWTLEQLDIWRPHVWEFSRLNITHVQLSKRKILKLVMEKTVRGWDDPRLPTIIGLRRRGYTAEAINAFCRDIGVTRNENQLQYAKLEYHVRNHLDQVARRDFVVLRPLKVTLVNVPADACYTLTAPDYPRDASAGSHALYVTRTIYIEEDDFREQDDKEFYGLAPAAGCGAGSTGGAPGKTVGLRYGGYLRVLSYSKDAVTGKVTELQCEYDHDRTVLGKGEKVKGNIHFVSGAGAGLEPPTVEVRLYEHLFTTETPGSTGDWEAELNLNSETVLQAKANPALVAPGRVKVFDKFQFERVGYFVCDQDSSATKLVFNQTVGLKEAADAKKVKGHA